MTRDTLHHPPKPATVGLGPDNERADQQAGSEASAARGSYEAPPGGVADGTGITGLIKDLRDESIHLLRQEVNLAKTEIQEKTNFFARQGGKLAMGLVVLAIGGLGLLSALSFLLGALIDHFAGDALNASAANGLGFLIIGTIAAIIGYTMYASGKKKLAEESLTPERTLQSLKDDKQWLSNKTSEATREASHAVKGSPAP